MWSLPDIKRMNAAAKTEAPSLEQQARTGIGPDGEKLTCDCADWGSGDSCSGDVYSQLWYDIFSDDPKGIISLCENHEGYYCSPTEGYFTCDDCGKVFVENYTWEMYRVDDSHAGETYCLPCAAEHYIADDENWITLTAKNIKAVDFERVRKVKHVIGVEMPTPRGIKFFENVEYDSYSGGQISGGNLQEILKEARQAGYKRALLILDAAYQFAVSVGVYVDSE